MLPVAGVLALIVIVQLPARQPAESQGARAAFGKILLLALSVLVISVASISKSLFANLAGIAIGLVISFLIVRMDLNATVRLLPTGAYDIRRPLGAIYACMSLLVIGLTTEIFVPYFLQTIHGYTPLLAGYLAALMAAGWTVGSLVSSGRSARAAQAFIRGGPLLVAVALVALAVIVPQQALLMSRVGFAGLSAALVAVGLGIGIGWPHLLTQVLTSAPRGQEDLASTSITTVQLYATAIGSALAGLVANLAGFSEPGGLAGTQQAAVWLFGVFAVSPLLAMLVAGRVHS